MVNEEKIIIEGDPSIAYPKFPGHILSFECIRCPTVFESKESLHTHMSLHGVNKKLKCDECDYSVNSSELLAKHIMRHRRYGNRAKTSTNSGSTSSSKSGSHQTIEDDGTLQCDECPAKFTRMSLLTVHRTHHGSEHRHKCPNCTFAVRRSDLFSKHLLVHDSEDISPKVEMDIKVSRRKTFKCSDCPAVLHGQRDYVRHLRRHSASGGYQCSECTFSSPRKESLTTHLTLHQTRNTGNNETVGASPAKRIRMSSTSLNGNLTPWLDERFHCLKCPLHFLSNEKLQEHSQCHGRNYFYRCNYCDYSSNSKIAKMRHEEHHATNTSVPKAGSPARRHVSKPTDSNYYTKQGRISLFNLSDSEYQRLRQGNPNIVYKAYTSGRGSRGSPPTTFKCLRCPYQNHDFTGYVSHQRYHDGTRLRYQCHICNYSVGTAPTFERHMELHKPDKVIRLNSSQRIESTGDDKNDITTKLDFRREIKIKTTTSSDNSENNASTEGEKKIPLYKTYSTKPFDAAETDTSKFLIENIKVINFMSIEMLELETTNILTFQGVGKSASLCALLVGLGYDIIKDECHTTAMCGIPVKDFIRHGHLESLVELTISLHSSPKLQTQFGTHLRIVRRLQRGLNLHLSPFEISSEDKQRRFSREPRTIDRHGFRKILKQLGIIPEIFRLMLLDEMNLNEILANEISWYMFYEVTCSHTKLKIQNRLTILTYKLKRLRGEIHWRRMKLDFLTEELMNCSEEDSWWTPMKKNKEIVENELSQYYELEEALQTTVNSYENELNKFSKTILGRLKFRFQEFLQRQNFAGSIFIDEDTKSVGICIKDILPTSDFNPRTAVEAMSNWSTTPTPLQRLAVIGLIFSLIDIAQCPIFFIDASSSHPGQFTLPEKALPVLFELIEKKCSQGHQFVTSLPNSYNRQ